MTVERFTDCEPIFIVGAGRSGTTLLQLMLNAHPSISIVGELHFFDVIHQIKEKVPDLHSQNELDDFFHEVTRTEHYHYLPDIDSVMADVRHRLEAADSRNYEKFFRYTLEAYATIDGATRIGEKTPENIEYLDELLEIFPNARIIHIIRDPRAVVASNIRIPGVSSDVMIHAISWKYDILFGKMFGARSSSYMELHYESLIADPETELKRICAFVGEEFVDEILKYHRTARRYVKHEPWKSGTASPVSDAPLSKWMNELSSYQICLVEKICGELMTELGYRPVEHSRWVRAALPLAAIGESMKYLRHKLQRFRGPRNSSERTGPSVCYYYERPRLYREFAQNNFLGRWWFKRYLETKH